MGILKKRSTKSASFFCKVRSFAAAAACLKASTDCSTCPPCSNRQTGQRVSVREIRYRKQASTVRNTHSVLKKASYGTRRIFRSIRCKKQASTVRKGYSVRKTASWGTRCVFKGAQNSTCYIERIFKGPQNSRLHRLWTASCSSGSSFSARHGLREEVSRQKKVVTIFRDHFFDM